MLDSELSKNFNQDQYSTTDSLNSITNVLNQATAKAAPIKTTKLQSPKFKLSLQVKTLMKVRKNYVFKWKQAGKPTKEHEISKKKKLVSKTLR